MMAEGQRTEGQRTEGREKPQPTIRSVLLVESSNTARAAMVSLLGACGDSNASALGKTGTQIRASEAEDGVAALCSLGTVKPDAVVMNIHSARLDGFQTCALIKNSDVFRHVRVVLVSDQDSMLEKSRAELAGADAFLVRPFRRAELDQALHGVVADPGNEAA